MVKSSVNSCGVMGKRLVERSVALRDVILNPSDEVLTDIPHPLLPTQSQDKPTLLLSHHKLEGKLVNLTKPLAVLKKCKRSSQLEEADLVENEDEDEDEDEGDETIRPRDDSNDLGDDDDEANTHRQPQSHGLPPSSPPNSQDIHLEMRALADSSSDDDEDEDGAGILQASPSLQRGKKRSPSRKQHTPTKSRRTRTNNTTTHSPPFPSSSPGPPPPMRGSAIDFSSPPPDGETTKDTRQRRTQVSYDVICIIRKKVLFSKRPEPVVHRA